MATEVTVRLRPLEGHWVELEFALPEGKVTVSKEFTDVELGALARAIHGR